MTTWAENLEAHQNNELEIGDLRVDIADASGDEEVKDFVNNILDLLVQINDTLLIIHDPSTSEEKKRPLERWVAKATAVVEETKEYMKNAVS